MAINIKTAGSTSDNSSSTSQSISFSSSDGDFQSITHPSRQANILIYGDEKTGKTTFCTMYAPSPVRVINFDGRADDAVYAAQQAGRDVKIARLFMPDGLTDRAQVKSAAQAIINRAEKNFELALADPNVRTILWDTVTEYQAICKLAFDGTMEKVKEHSHGEPGDFQNQCIWRLINRARKAKSTHLIFTARATEIWKDQKPTGIFKPQCPKAVKAGVDWSGQIRLKTVFGIPKPEFEIEVKDAGLDITQLGEVYTAAQWDRMGGPFVYSCLMNYPDSEMEEWQ